MKKCLAISIAIITGLSTSLLAQQGVVSQQISFTYTNENVLLQEIEILRRLVNKEVTTLSAKCDTLSNGGIPEQCAASKHHGVYWDFSSSYGAQGNVRSATNQKKPTKVLANYIKGFGVVVTLEAPSQTAKRPTTSNEDADEWNRIRQELSGSTSSSAKEKQEVLSLEESLTKLLFKFGPRVSGLSDGDEIAIAANFQSQSIQTQACAKCHQSNNSPLLGPEGNQQVTSLTSLGIDPNGLDTRHSVELLATLKLRQGDLESAKQALENLLADDADKDVMKRNASKLAQIYLQLGEYDDAAKTLERIQSSPKENDKAPVKDATSKQVKQLVLKISKKDLSLVGQKKMTFAEFRDALDVSYMQ